VARTDPRLWRLNELVRSAAPRRGPFLLWQQNAAGILARRRLGLLQCVVEEKGAAPAWISKHLRIGRSMGRSRSPAP